MTETICNNYIIYYIIVISYFGMAVDSRYWITETILKTFRNKCVVLFPMVRWKLLYWSVYKLKKKKLVFLFPLNYYTKTCRQQSTDPLKKNCNLKFMFTVQNSKCTFYGIIVRQSLFVDMYE